MTETGTIIQAKAEAINSMATALTNAIASGQVGSMADVQNFLAAWTAGVNAMLPTEATVVYKTAQDAQPPIGSVVEDRDSDIWTRTENGNWRYGQSDARTYPYAEILRDNGPLTLI